MIFIALSEAADRGELLLVEGGLCRFHLRRDGTTVIREILVLPALRRRGIGRQLVGRIVHDAPGPVVARCPTCYESNGFWARMGFVRGGTIGGMNVWHHPSSSTAPIGTARSPGPR